MPHRLSNQLRVNVHNSRNLAPAVRLKSHCLLLGMSEAGGVSCFR